MHPLPSQGSVLALGAGLEGTAVSQAVSLCHRAAGPRKVAETAGQAGFAAVEPSQNAKAKTKLVGKCHWIFNY